MREPNPWTPSNAMAGSVSYTWHNAEGRICCDGPFCTIPQCAEVRDQYRLSQTQGAGVTVTEERTNENDKIAPAKSAIENGSKTEGENIEATSVAEEPSVTWQERLRLLADKENADWPLEVDGPHDEKYVSARVLRGVALLAGNQMGWCDTGVSETISRLGLPPVARANRNTNWRGFRATVTLTDVVRVNGTVSMSVSDRNVVIADMQYGVDGHNRGMTAEGVGGHLYSVEVGEVRNTTRRTVTYEGDEVISETTLTRNFIDVTVTGFYETSASVRRGEEPTNTDRERVRNRTAQLISYNRNYSLVGYDALNGRPETGKTYDNIYRDMTFLPAPAEAIEFISDDELMNTYSRITRDDASLTGR